MKNFEKYEDEIKKYKGDNFCKDFVIPHILKKDDCAGIYCSECISRQLLWYLEEYEEPEVDWGNVEVDTPILVRNSEYGEWFKRHFAEYKNGKVYTWDNGYTSWTACGYMGAWNYAKLTEDEKEPEVDWSKVEVDTPILVKYSEKGMWIRRKFAKFEDGVVYAWHGKETGHSKSYMTPWNYAKLAESERKDNINESNANNRR